MKIVQVFAVSSAACFLDSDPKTKERNVFPTDFYAGLYVELYYTSMKLSKIKNNSNECN
jgi:hypothetical protein